MAEFDEDLASMFEASHQAKRIGRGQTVEGTLVGIGHEVAFVDVGGKGEAVIDLAELRNDEGELEVAVGDRVHAVVVSTEGGITLSRRLARGAATDKHLEEAYNAGRHRWKVEQDVKGDCVRVGRHERSARSRRSTLFATPNRRSTSAASTRSTSSVGRRPQPRVSRRACSKSSAPSPTDQEDRRGWCPLTGRVTSVRDFGAFVGAAAFRGASRVRDGLVRSGPRPVKAGTITRQDRGWTRRRRRSRSA